MEIKNIYNTVKNVHFRNAIYANGQWIITAIGVIPDKTELDGKYHICTSSNLETFEDSVLYTTLETNNMARATIAFGNGLYIVSIKSNTIFLSSDLKIWENISIYDLINVDTNVRINFINGQFIIITWNGYILTSKTGKNWTIKSKLNEHLNKIVYYNVLVQIGNYYY